jgi:ribonuclease G
LIKPVHRIHKEVIINAESLETRVAVLEDGKLEEFTIERTSDERLVGSIFKGKVKNLEDGLKAAFVDIGFEKNAFLHYWDIVLATFDSGVEVVEREGRRREKPRITQKDIPRLYPPGSEIIVQVTKGPIGTKGPRVTAVSPLPEAVGAPRDGAITVSFDEALDPATVTDATFRVHGRWGGPAEGTRLRRPA